MILPPSLINYITEYGYLAVFSLIFVQEIGVPNPIPNEIILLFAGYLSSIGVLKFPLIFLVAVSGDFFGTTILFIIFYFLGETIIKRSPRWLPIKKIEKFKKKLEGKTILSIYLGRLLPYLRGYASVAAGLLEIPPKKFLLAVFFSAMTWSGGYVIAGRLLGKEWEKVMVMLTPLKLATISIFIVVLIFFIIPAIRKYFKKTRI